MAGGGAVTKEPQWQQEIAARSVLPVVLYRPGRQAAQIRCPLLVVVAFLRRHLSFVDDRAESQSA